MTQPTPPAPGLCYDLDGRRVNVQFVEHGRVYWHRYTIGADGSLTIWAALYANSAEFAAMAARAIAAGARESWLNADGTLTPTTQPSNTQ